MLTTTLTRLGESARSWVSLSPWTNVYGAARTLLALGTLSVLLFSPTEALFTPVRDRPDAPYCDGARAISYFCVVPSDHLELARWLGVLMLAVVASGWRPRFTAIPHWWLAFSLQASMSVPDGGDQVAVNLTLLLLPIALTDGRRWHWGNPAPGESSRREVPALVAVAALLLIRIQVSGIYLHASLGKLGVPEWRDGTALYYWLSSPSFGAPGWLRGPLGQLLATGPVVAGLTWGTLALEFSLAIALFLSKRRWPALLVGGLALHAGIAVVMGLWSFSLCMFAALVLYLRPREQLFVVPEPVRRAVTHIWPMLAARLPGAGRALSQVDRWRRPAERVTVSEREVAS